MSDPRRRATRTVRTVLAKGGGPAEVVAALADAGLLVDERAQVDTHVAYGTLTDDGTAVQMLAPGDTAAADAGWFTRRTIEEPWTRKK